MKKILLIIVILLLVFKIGQGQTNKYHPFPDSNAVWCDTVPCGVCSYAITGDTLVNGYTYHKLQGNQLAYLLDNFSFCDTQYLHFYSFYAGAIRQDIVTRKVYYLPKNSSTDTILYDFTLNVGDTLRTYNNIGFKHAFVTAIDSILIGTKYRKRWSVDLGAPNNGYHFYEKIIEGIGSTGGLIQQNLLYPISKNPLYCFSHNNEILYPNYVIKSRCSQITSGTQEEYRSESFSVFPNPSNGSFTIDFGTNYKYKEMQIINLLGKIVFRQSINNQSKINIDNLPGGVYILTVIDNENKRTNQKIISSP